MSELETLRAALYEYRRCVPAAYRTDADRARLAELERRIREYGEAVPVEVEDNDTPIVCQPLGAKP